MFRSSVPKAAASRRRLPDTAATISYRSAPTRLKYLAFGEDSITALRSASETASSCTSISPMAISFSTKDRKRNLSRSTLRGDIGHSHLVVRLEYHLARRIDHRVDAARELDRAVHVHVEGRARVILAADPRRPRRPHDLRAQRLDRGVELGGRKNLADDAGLARPRRAHHRGRPDQIGHGLARHPVDQRRHHHGRHDVVRHLGNLKLGGVGGERDVADRRDGAAEAEGAALDDADHRDFAAPEGAVAIEHHVVAAAKLDRHGVGGGVADLGPVQGDFQQGALAGSQDLVGHGRSSWQWNFAPKEFNMTLHTAVNRAVNDCSDCPAASHRGSVPMPASDTRSLPPQTEPALRAIAMPADANPHGDIFGGWLLSQMDLAGGTVATRRAKGRTG